MKTIDIAVAIANELAAIDGYDASDQHCGLYDLRWSGGSNPEPLGDAWTMDYLPKGERIAAALRSADHSSLNAIYEGIIGSVSPDDPKLDVAYAIARYLKLDCPCAYEQPSAPEPVTDELIDEAVNCAWHVAGTTLHSREDIKAAVKAIYPMFVGRAFPPAPRSDDASRESAASVAAQEPVGEVKDNPDDIGTYVDLERSLPIGTKLYTHPTPLRPVTDEDARVACKTGMHPLAEPSAVEIKRMRAALESFLSRRAGEGA